MIWLCGGIIAASAFSYWPQVLEIPTDRIVIWGWALLAAPILIGRRSRAWLSIPAGALAIGVNEFLNRHGWVSMVWDCSAVNLPYAALMLYGTRLLTPEERALRAASAAKKQAARKHAA
jgi:hypothetical protein